MLTSNGQSAVGESGAWACWLPRIAASLAAVIGVMNILSALTPDLASRAAVVLRIAPAESALAAHALALPAGVALITVAYYLGRRRRRAWELAFVLLLLLGVLNLIKGLDIEEAAASWSLAVLLLWARPIFNVGHSEDGLRTAAILIPAFTTVAYGVSLITVWAGSHHASPDLTWSLALREAAALLGLTTGPVHFQGAFHWLPLAVGSIGLALLLTTAFFIFRPRGGPKQLPKEFERRRARELVLKYGYDTLSFFKLREDQHYLFSRNGEAFVAYRVEGGVLLVAGDPVGPPGSILRLMQDVCAFAEKRGLRIGVVGASATLAALSRRLGLRSIYIGDEAVVDVSSFSLEGRPIRKVRQSISRLVKRGFTSEMLPLDDLSTSEITELETSATNWRNGEPERGFSMAMDSLKGRFQSDSVVVIARDCRGHLRGYLHFVPSYGRSAMSLAAMHRDPDTPNGTMEFLIVRAIESLKTRGVSELSLNFAAFSRMLRDPEGVADELLRPALAVANRYAQIERLYRFNAKFFPRWQPRYLLYETRFTLPRTGIAALWAEGILPKLNTPRLRPLRPASSKET